MNKQAMRIAIAEARRWKLEQRVSKYIGLPILWFITSPTGEESHLKRTLIETTRGPDENITLFKSLDGDVLDFVGMPNYPADLNAMHDAENIFVQHDGCVWGPMWEAYCNALARICALAEPTNCLARAKADQRAEAFCRTIYPERFK